MNARPSKFCISIVVFVFVLMFFVQQVNRIVTTDVIVRTTEWRLGEATGVGALGWLSRQNQHCRFSRTCLCFSICICFCIWTWKTKNISASFEICKNIWTVVGALGWLSRQNQHWRFNLTCLCFSICICFCIWTWETKNISASLEICKISGPSAGLLAD